jgi:hypothetical protein
VPPEFLATYRTDAVIATPVCGEDVRSIFTANTRESRMKVTEYAF